MEVPSPRSPAPSPSCSAEPGPADQGRRRRSSTYTAGRDERTQSRPPTPRTDAAADRADRLPMPSAAANGVDRPVRVRAPVKAAPSVRHLARKLGIDLTPRSRQRAGGPHPARGSDAADCGGRTPAARRQAEPPRRLRPAGHARQVRRAAPQDRRAHGPRRSGPSRTTPTSMSATSPNWCGCAISLREPFARQGVKLTYLPFFVKAVVAALKEVPIVNASLDEDGRRDRAARPLPHRHRRRDAGRPDRAGGARRRPEGPGRRSPARSSGSAPRPAPASRAARTCAAARSRSRRSAASAG